MSSSRSKLAESPSPPGSWNAESAPSLGLAWSASLKIKTRPAADQTTREPDPGSGAQSELNLDYKVWLFVPSQIVKRARGSPRSIPACYIGRARWPDSPKRHATAATARNEPGSAIYSDISFRGEPHGLGHQGRCRRCGRRRRQLVDQRALGRKGEACKMFA